MNTINKLQIIALSGFLLTATACSSLSKNGENTPSSSSTTTAPIFTASSDPRADVVKALRKTLEAKSFRMRETTTSSSGHNTTKTTEIMMPDRMHMITETDTPGKSPVKQEQIFIGEESYWRVGDTPWQKRELGMGSLMSQMRDPKLIDEITKNAEVKYLGTDTLDGAPMLIYQYTQKDFLGPGINLTSKVWIGAADAMQHKQETEFESDSYNADSSVKEKKDPVKSTTIVDYSTDIKIEPPIK